MRPLLAALVLLLTGCYELNNPMDPKAANYAGTSGGVPATPAGVVAVGGDTTVTLTWNSVSGATGYRLYWSTTSTVVHDAPHTVSGVSSGVVRTGLANGTPYWFDVTAVNAEGESASSTVNATPQAAAVGVLRLDGVGSTLDFGVIPAVSPISFPLRLTNTGNASLDISEITTNSKAWGLLIGAGATGSYTTILSTPFSLAPGASQLVSIEYEGLANPTGPRPTDALVVTSGGATSKTWPLAVDLESGQSSASISIVLSGTNSQYALNSATNPITVDWGTQSVDTTLAPLTVTVQNSGLYTYRSATAALVSGADFHLSSTLGIPTFLAGGSSFSFDVSLPTAAGSYSDDLVIHNTDSTNATYHLTLIRQ